METIVRKQIACIWKYMVKQHLGRGRGNAIVIIVFFLHYVPSFYISCMITALLKANV